MNNEVDEASLCILLGKMYEEEKKLDESLHYFQQALTVSKQLRLVQMMGVSYLGVARVLSMKDEWSRVENCARASITMGILIGDEEMENEAMVLIGKTQINKGETGLARKVYLKVLRRMKEKNENEKSALIHFDVARISDEESASYHFWTCFAETDRVNLKIESLLHLSSLPSTSTDSHYLLRASLAYAIGEKKMESLLQLSRRERELDWIEEAMQTSSFALIKYSDSEELDPLIADLSSFHPRFASSLLLSLYSKRKDRRILFRIFRTMPQFAMGEIDNYEGEERQLLQYLCHSVMGLEVDGIHPFFDEKWNDLLCFSLSSFVGQMEKRRKMIEEAPMLMVETIESDRIDRLTNQYDELLLNITQFDCLPPQFAIDSFSFCTIVISLFIPSIDNLLHILDLAQWALAGQGVTPPSSVVVPSIPFTRLFSCGNITMIWSCSDGKDLAPSYYLSSPPSTPLEDALLSLLESQSLSHSTTLINPADSLLIGFPPLIADITTPISPHSFSLYSPSPLPLHSPSSSLLIIDLDHFHPSNAVIISKDQYICPILLIRKILSCDVCITSVESIIQRIPSPLLLSSTTIQSESKSNFAPSLVILTHFSTLSSYVHSIIFHFFARRTKTVIILPEKISPSEMERIIDEIGQGLNVDLSTILPLHSIVMGERVLNHRTSTCESLRMSLKRGCLTSESPFSFFVSTLLNVVPPPTLDHFLHLPLETKELNEIYSRLIRGELMSELEVGTQRESAIYLFNVIFSDHLFTLDDPIWESQLSDLPSALSHLHPPDIKDHPLSPAPRSESRGYQSEGDNGRNSMIESSSFPSQGKYSVSATDRSRNRRKGEREKKEKKRSASVNHSLRVPKPS
ncbi:hypothetical protein PENTCL1PPCAC_29924 [Pristionchus entomophagus]|uniref:Uncharacterized protein n=1 Tax=Pristionchus entomophagus TaxID=358040 RepID=A0AAV5UNF3_9BILA|nr:hypothetical protein PENTCL1PPCAC_29924 [Pristionchus entomophagus]